jgi:hypothetical protein
MILPLNRNGEKIVLKQLVTLTPVFSIFLSRGLLFIRSKISAENLSSNCKRYDPVNKESYGKINTVQIDNETYQIQPVEFEDERFFFVKNHDGIICMIMQNENNEWGADCYISEELFRQIMGWVNKLYLSN